MCTTVGDVHFVCSTINCNVGGLVEIGVIARVGLSGFAKLPNEFAGVAENENVCITWWCGGSIRACSASRCSAATCARNYARCTSRGAAGSGAPAAAIQTLFWSSTTNAPGEMGQSYPSPAPPHVPSSLPFASNCRTGGAALQHSSALGGVVMRPASVRALSDAARCAIQM